MIRHVLLKHTVDANVPFRCSVCDFVTTTENEITKHAKWDFSNKNRGEYHSKSLKEKNLNLS